MNKNRSFAPQRGVDIALNEGLQRLEVLDLIKSEVPAQILHGLLRLERLLREFSHFNQCVIDL
jgi:hypothetical protein